MSPDRKNSRAARGASTRGLVGAFACAVCLHGAAVAGPAASRLEEALLSADLVVVGSLGGVEKRAESWAATDGPARTGESGRAQLRVERILSGGSAGADRGSPDRATTVSIEWTYLDRVDPVESRNPHVDGAAGIYFLACADRTADCSTGAGNSTAFAEQFWVPEESLASVVALFGRYPARLAGEASYAAGRAVPISITLENRTDAPLELPSIRFEDGKLRLGPGAGLVVRRRSREGPEAPRRIGRIRPDPEAAPLSLPAGESWALTLDLQKIYGLMDAGYYVAELSLEGLPPQAPLVIRVE